MRMTDLRITAEPPTCLLDYARVPSAFDVTGRLDASSGEIAPIAKPFVKNYDAHRGHHPTEWPQRFDVSRWCFAAAFMGDRRVGGAVVVPDVADVEPDLAAPDAALLWDIRVMPDARRLGVARALLAFAESRARAAGRARMLVETQDINVPACRLYAAAGYVLVRVEPHAYPSLPDETRLIWQKQLSPGKPEQEVPA
jgi:ribosomal protein S18 acetylase RimI-like enzyme